MTMFSGQRVVCHFSTNYFVYRRVDIRKCLASRQRQRDNEIELYIDPEKYENVKVSVDCIIDHFRIIVIIAIHNLLLH